jgi:hypothetical protein
MIAIAQPFNILNYLDLLTADGGSETATERSFLCPVCAAPNFKIVVGGPKAGTYGTYGCDCAATEAGKRAIREALAPATWQKPPRPENRQTFTYDRLIQGQPEAIAEVVRGDDGSGKRQFHQRHWDGRRWVSGLSDSVKTELRLYRVYSEVNEKAKGKTPILIVEGEGKADRLISLGIPATCGIGGAGKWKKYGYPNYLEDLNGYQVVLCPDRDKPGLRHCEEIEADLKAHGIEVAGWLYSFPESFWWGRLPENQGADIADWLEDLGKQLPAEQIRERILSAIEPRRNLNQKPEPPPSSEDKPPKPERRAIADQLLDLVVGDGSGVKLFHTPDQEAYADIYSEGARKTYPLRRKAFRQWLKHQFYLKSGKSPGSEAVEQAIGMLEAIAVFEGEIREVYLRTAEHEGRVYLDLGRDDWQVVEVGLDGWRLVSDPPVRFRRAETQLPLPIPEAGGSLESLRELLGLSSETWVMVSAWLLNCLKFAKNYPCLILHGEAGSGKSTLSSVLKRLIDPGRAPLLPSVGDLRNLAIQANNRHLIAYDNLSGVSAEQSDAICRIATGGGFAHRTLHTDCEETVFEFTKPQLLNGIDALATRGDLLDRSLLVSLTRPQQRRDAAQFWAEFEQLHPQILGALLDTLSAALRKLPEITTSLDVRMIEFARLAIAAEEALGFAPGEFLATYQGNREEAHETAIEASPVAQAILDLMSDREFWRGTASVLLAELKERVGETTAKSKSFPADATRLSKILNRLKPDLRGVGIEIDSYKEGKNRTRYITFEKISPPTQEADARRTLGENLASATEPPAEKAFQESTDARRTLGEKSENLASATETPAEKAFQESTDTADAADAKNLSYSGGGLRVGDCALITGPGIDRATTQELIAVWEIFSIQGDRVRVRSELGDRTFPQNWLVKKEVPCGS